MTKKIEIDFRPPHPLIPPTETLEAWKSRFSDQKSTLEDLLIEAYQKGADRELEESCVWVENYAECGEILFKSRRDYTMSEKSIMMKYVAEGISGEKKYHPDKIAHIQKLLEEMPDD